MLNRIVLGMAMLVSGIGVHAQSRYRFYTLTMEQGLTSDVVWSICKDKYGFMWMATQNGLNRYDGHRIKQYLHDNKDSFSIPGNVVYWVHRDGEGGLWFSFGSQGVARYNYFKDRFERFYPFDSITRKHNYLKKSWRMGNDEQGRVYFANGSSCFRYSNASGKMDDLTPLFRDKLKGHDIGMFLPRGRDTIWITTNNGLFRYNLSRNEMRHFPFDAEKFGFGDANMHDAEFINDHVLLVAVVRTGFVLFDIRTGMYSFPPPPIDPSGSKLFSETGGVLKDKKGRIWLANSRYGLLEYIPATNSIYSLKNEPAYPYPYPEQEGSGLNVYEDDEGNIWYGSSGRGVIWFKPGMDFLQTFSRDFSKPQSLPNTYVTNFLPLEKNTMLIATLGGLTAFNRTSATFHNFPIAFSSREIYPHANIRCLMRHGDSVFITTGLGLSIYNARTEAFSRFIDTAAAFTSVFPNGQWLLHYLNGKIFLTGQEVARFDLQTKRYEYPVSLSDKEPVYTLTDPNASFYDDETGTLWIEAGVSFLYSYHISTRTLKRHRFTTDSVQMIDAIRKDRDGKLWIGTYKGLYTYHPLTGEAEKIQLHTTAEAVYNIAIQDDRFVWMATPAEVIRYDRIRKKTDILSSHSIFPNSILTKRAFLLDGDQLWIGTTRGFAILDTRRFQTEVKYKQPQVVHFLVFDKTRSFDRPLSELDRIVLGYKENFFSFALSAFNYQGPVEYNFMLKGFDKDWQKTNSASGSYTNVPPGTYQLYIKSKHSSEGWIERVHPITIHIKAPFWQTWWFFTTLAIGLLLLAGLVVSMSKKRVRKKEIDATIDYFANSLYGENSISEICWDIARNCISQLKLEDCVVYLLDDKKMVLVQQAAYGPKNPKEHEIINPMEIRIGEGIVGTAALTAKHVLIRDTTRDARYIIDDEFRLSELAVPIVHEGKTIGVIDSENSKKNFFTEDHVKALSTIAAISANKIAEAKAEQAAKESEIQLLEIKKLLAESQLMALRAQMNPHFVFNCLNSIQECIVTEKYGEASLYLNKFSKLFRSVLNNSGKVLITLAEEIEVLELYLALEHMRFEKSFAYHFHVEEDLETDEIMIPSMLLQPYVENALWHGLMHKQGDRLLTICFSKTSEEIFQCVVDDNGIGRKKALELKEQQSKTKRHVSKGMTISKDRIELLQKQGQHAQLRIIDKMDDDGTATGTKVVIELSTYLKA